MLRCIESYVRQYISKELCHVRLMSEFVKVYCYFNKTKGNKASTCPRAIENISK